jgi:type 2A phosphatase activator TIP41
MADCCYFLLRFYLRVDQVLIRVFDTRLFHSFGDNHMTREFTHKEATYEHVAAKGFKTSSTWALSPTQADEVLPNLEEKLKVVDKI